MFLDHVEEMQQTENKRQVLEMVQATAPERQTFVSCCSLPSGGFEVLDNLIVSNPVRISVPTSSSSDSDTSSLHKSSSSETISEEANAHATKVTEALRQLGGRGTTAEIVAVIEEQMEDDQWDDKRLTRTVNGILSSRKYSQVFQSEDPILVDGRETRVWRLVGDLPVTTRSEAGSAVGSSMGSAASDSQTDSESDDPPLPLRVNESDELSVVRSPAKRRSELSDSTDSPRLKR